MHVPDMPAIRGCLDAIIPLFRALERACLLWTEACLALSDMPTIRGMFQALPPL
jgi:ribosomal protein L30/L7E